MSFSVITTNIQRHRFLICIIFFSILVAIITFSNQCNQISPFRLNSNNVKEQTDAVKKEYLARIHEPFSLSILRGILIFYPEDQESHFFPEFLWLYRSWIEMMKYESSLWRTDLIIYTGNYSRSFEQLGCLYNQIRMNRDESPQCRVFPYKRLKLRNIDNKPYEKHSLYQQIDKNFSNLLTKHLYNYSYIDSINVLAEYYPSYSMYNYILRTDIDVFLTKSFGRFVPYNDTIIVGRGGYSTPFNSARLRRIANDIKWLYANLTSLGSTWYGPPDAAQRVANLGLEAMLYLSNNEFTTPERTRKVTILLWPEWHYGVLLLYGCQLAFNHLASNRSINLGLGYELLDQSSTNKDKDDIEKNHRLHLHCWFTLEPFSKQIFKTGQYNHLKPETFLNDTSASGYAMRMVLESRSMSLTELKQKLIDTKMTLYSNDE